MSRKTDIFHQIATLLACTLLLSACLKEDWSNCPEEIRVYFDITPPNGGDAINPDDVDQMHLYVFDHNDLYLGDYLDAQVTFSDDYHIGCSDLLPGNYRFIAWGGEDEDGYSVDPGPFVKGETHFDDALLKLKHPLDLVVQPPLLHHLFHSELRATVTRAKVQRFDMPLAQITNTIHISVTGLSPDVNEYVLNITDNNNDYHLNRSFANGVGDATFTYTAPCVRDATGQLNSTLNVMRLAVDRRTPQLQIFNATTGTVIFPAGTQTGDLIGLILNANPQNDFEKTHTYNIVLNFTGNGVLLSVIVNGWVIDCKEIELF